MKTFHFSPTRRQDVRGFTLVEVLVSLAILAVLLTIIAQVLGQVQRVWSSANSRVAQFREARRAMERITSNLSQATLNTYFQYFYGGGNPIVPPNSQLRAGPLGYVRFSELQFISGPSSTVLSLSATESPGHAVFFQAPLGGGLEGLAGSNGYINLPTGLSACGYYLSFGSDRNFRPGFLNQRSHPERERYRLMEYRPPLENNVIYDQGAGGGAPGVPNPNWYRQITNWSRPVAENIVLMIISPKRPVFDGTGDPRDIAPDYLYDSSANGMNLNQAAQDFQLPPLVEVTLVALDEVSAQRLADQRGSAVGRGLFTQATDQTFRSDIEALEVQLNNQKLNYRVFTATVAIRGSKWGL
jgi:uncharacterized protein (TIGR02599 family)